MAKFLNTSATNYFLKELIKALNAGGRPCTRPTLFTHKVGKGTAHVPRRPCFQSFTADRFTRVPDTSSALSVSLPQVSSHSLQQGAALNGRKSRWLRYRDDFIEMVVRVSFAFAQKHVLKPPRCSTSW